MSETMTPPPPTKPVVLLIHCAFADAATWGLVIPLLHEAEAEVVVVPNPLRGLRKDAAYVASFARQIDGPVVMVGHGYGGAVITNAALGAGNVIGLVYIAAAAVDEGECLTELLNRFPESSLGPALRPMSYPNGGSEYTIEMMLDRALFPEVFAADLPIGVARTLAAGQRPLTLDGLEERSGPPAWKSLPSWHLIATDDRIWQPAGQRFVAERAGSLVAEVAASHAVTVSQPRAVADLILAALRTFG